jgi:2-polyprenyl-6-methoxyphenol hydroxylase-like FAD-dependent oxidoreductase
MAMAGRRHAEIAGAGFSGLAVATALAQRGWSVRVHERAPEVRAFGAGIWLWDNGIRVLNALGAADEALDGCTEARVWESWDRKGGLVDRVEFGVGGASRVFCVVRQQLLQALLHAAERAGVVVETGSEATGARADGTLLLASGAALKADLVIGADGVRSSVRDSLGLLKKRHVHIDGAIRVLIPRTAEEYESAEGRKIREWWSGTRRLLYTPCTREVVYLCFTMMARDRAATAIPLRKEVWSRSLPRLAHLIERVGTDGRYDRFETSTPYRWSKGRVAILGDAAHSMSPGLGQGGGSSLVGALTLAALLEEGGTTEPALQGWEAALRPLAEHTQFWSKVTWPLIPWPAWLARRYYALPLAKGWIARQRMRPSLHVARGTEGQPIWVPTKT